jgi:hypothetical protein
MKPRAVRIPLEDATVAFDGRAVRLVNISRTGALVRLARPHAAGTEGSLTVTHAYTTVTIDGRVVRVALAESPGAEDALSWQAAIAFTAPPPDEITALLRRLVAPRPVPPQRVRA